MTQLIDSILAPSGFIALLIVASGLLLFLFKRRKPAGYVICVAALFYVVFSLNVTTMWLMGGLEGEFAPGQVANASPSLNTIVILTGYALADSHRPISGRVNSASGLRSLEAVRLFRRTGGMKIIISGSGEVPVIMKELLADLGIPLTHVETDVESVSTYESAVHLRDRLSGKPFFLVTSAGHMPRALRVFRKLGLSAVPAPTDFLAPAALRELSVVPSGRNLSISDQAVREYLGLIWYRLMDRI